MKTSTHTGPFWIRLPTPGVDDGNLMCSSALVAHPPQSLTFLHEKVFRTEGFVVSLYYEKPYFFLLSFQESGKQDAAHKAMEMQLAEAESRKRKDVAELMEHISILEKELDNANDVLSDTARRAGTTSAPVLPDKQLSTMSPTVAAVAKIRPSMKLTELYMAYLESLEQLQLQLEKVENKRVNKYLDDIVQEVEAKAHILKRQREELERAQISVASLSAKLEHAEQEEADEANKHASKLERDNQRFEMQLCDMAHQVQVLLIELEEARGNHMVRDEEDVSSANVSSASEVISQHLVTFRGVAELQQQNRRLLVALRELADAQTDRATD
ncbi:nucleoprotein TPR-like [Ictalurus furcatus]|uniref:nucleoprotein TPR-like n=1 Tax=Ictalurus furcatus TaxID=66913 RepID=UPI002350C778|nr:nucleoprotein TPR-like [Ictalurus furcatus]